MPSSSAYAGYVPRAGDRVAVEPASLSAHDMWERYIAPRKPVVLNGLLDDPQWRGTSWTDLAHLRQQAGDAVVRVEPVHPQDDCFGTATPRTTMTFAEYLDTLQHDTAGKYYLTTQYELDEPPASDDLDAGPGLDTLLPTPTHRLLPDFPLHPRLLGRLVLQQCNLWLGNSHQPKSSGLHHDFHDNLYILLSGHKRFVLFPPSAHDTLALRGSVQRVHPNGLIVYEDPGRIRADGLDALEAAHWRVAARARTLHARPTKRARGANNEAQAAYDDAKDTFLLLRETYDDADGAAAWDSADEGDVNALEEGDGDEEDEEDAAASASSGGRVASRLDPALFAAAFAHRDAQARAALQHSAPSPAPAPKRRYARGRDGQPMVRVAHEATLVRALAPEREVDVVDAALEHEPLDPSRALPSARERAYRKRKLGLRANDVRASAIDAVKRAPAAQRKPHAKDPEDPLGLNDPAFQEGGEYAHLARPKRKRTHARTSTPAATAVRGAGGRVAAPHAARLGPALQFARGR